MFALISYIQPHDVSTAESYGCDYDGLPCIAKKTIEINK